VDIETIRRYPTLTDWVTGGAPVGPAGLTMRFAFRLPSVADGAAIGGAIARFAPGQWAAGTTVAPSE